MNVQTLLLPLDVPFLPARILKSGELTCLYEHGKLRYIKCGEVEVVRMIYFAVRNEDWNTAAYTIRDEVIEEKNNGFAISYTATHTLPDIEYEAFVNIIAEGNTISFSVKSIALSTFKRNRIGLCVHHPIKEYSAKEATIKKPDGTIYVDRFPGLISPHQPFKNIQEMECVVNDSLLTKLIFEGEVFETEDQRNWADSSYKTYGTPLSLPFPVEVTKGDKLEQKVELSVIPGDLHKGGQQAETRETKIAFPQIGYSRSIEERLNKEEIHLLKELPFERYRVELFLGSDKWQEELRNIQSEAKELEAKLEMVLFFTDDFKTEWNSFLQALRELSCSIDSILLLQSGVPTTPGHLLSLAYEDIKKLNASIKVGYGTNGFFADLNRQRPLIHPFDFICFSLNPQVHASDTRSVLENLEHLEDLVETAHSFAGGAEVYVSPITLKIRASAFEGTTGSPSDSDERQHTSFGAIWTLTALKNLSHADSLCFFQTTGYRGIIDGTKPIEAQSPLFLVLKTIKHFRPKWIIADSAFSPGVNTIQLENEEGDRLQFRYDLSASGIKLPTGQS